MRHIYTFKDYLSEGGNALDNTRPIKQSEVQSTLDSIQDVVFPALNLSGWGTDALLIGSAGKKESDESTSGDLDIGLPMKEFCEMNGVSEDLGLKYAYDMLTRRFPEFRTRWMRGINVVSLSYPIKGDPNLGYVQVDFMPIKDMRWAKFIYHSPDQKKGESKYKSAVRNWLFAAILSTLTDDKEYDEDGNLLGFSGYMLRLGEGLSKIKRSHVGKTGLLKNSVLIKDEERLLTNSPDEFLEFVLGPGIKAKDAETFESVLNIITSPSYKWKDNVEQIIETFKRFLNRVKLQVPDEIKRKEPQNGTTGQ